MTTKFYVDSSGNYLGGFGEEINAPVDSTEVTHAPGDSRQLWDFIEEEWLPLSGEAAWTITRAERNERLAAMDWRVIRYMTQVAAGVTTTESEETYLNVLSYMQELRDIPENFEDPAFVEWSEIP